MNKNNNIKENQVIRLILLLLPFVLFFLSVLLTVIWLYNYIYSTSPLFKLVINSPSADYVSDTETDNDDDTGYIIVPPDTPAPETTAPPETEKQPSPEIIKPAADFPVIRYQEQWATLNVEGWDTINIPVYFGDTDKILSKGAGMQFSSRFCGQNGKTVLSAHVTSHFYEIEDVKIGDKVTVDTVYGRYIYSVDDIVIFDYTDSSLLMPDEGNSSLVMYTCYPRTDGLAFKQERIALVCSMTEGVKWIGR
jgi:LPXTG-site transpeptidase (sortase) family protein